MKIEFAPGCFDHFEGSQEELDSLINEIQRMADTGELFENSRELTDDDFDELPAEIKEQIALLDSDENHSRRTLQ